MRTLSTIFAAGVNIRNALYDRRMFKVNRLARPVVSIGNISVGGSGKTPFVIALGEILKQRGVAFDVLSRGYRRKSSAVALVTWRMGVPFTSLLPMAAAGAPLLENHLFASASQGPV